MKSKAANLQLRIGMCLLAAIIVLMVLLFFRGLSIDINLDKRWHPPSSRYPLGTDGLGRDLLSCVVYGAGVSLVIGLAVVTLSALIGGVLGLVSGLAGGLVDVIIMRAVDIISAFPGLLLAIALASFFNPGVLNLVFVLTFSSWVGYARLIRGEVLRYKQMEFVLAARSYNASFFRIIFHHLLPIILPLWLVQASLAIGGVMLAESSLNFLGLGLDPEIPTLGQLIDAGVAHIFDRPTLVLAPGLVLFLLIISLNYIGEGLSRKFTR